MPVFLLLQERPGREADIQTIQRKVRKMNKELLPKTETVIRIQAFFKFLDCWNKKKHTFIHPPYFDFIIFIIIV